MMQRRIIHLITCFCVLLLPMLAYAEPVNIGIVLDGPKAEQEELLSSVKYEIDELTRGEFEISFPNDKILAGDWKLATVQSNLDLLFNDPDIDLIITMGYISSHHVCHLNDLPKPVIAPLVWDAGFQELPVTDGKSGVQNLNYINVPFNFERDVSIFREIVEFDHLAVLVDQVFLDNFPESREKCSGFFNNLKISCQVIGVGPENLLKLTVPEDAQAVYVLSLGQLSEKGFGELVEQLQRQKLPSFAYDGSADVGRGILAGLNTDDFNNRLSRRVALNVQRILLGDRPQDIPVSFSFDQQLTFNMTTGQAINVYPSWAIMTEARIIEMEKEKDEPAITMLGAIKEAIDVNLDLLARERYVTAGNENIALARANLLPQIEISATGVQIDKDRAKNSMGQQAERTLSGNVTATQVLFSEPAFANMSIQKKLQKSREQEYRQLELDIIQSAATAYLNVLTAKAYERIQYENLQLTRSNLELARVREMVGSAGPAEVYRWESLIASNRNEVITANAQRNLAEIELNRILHRPSEAGFTTLEVDIDNPDMVTSQQDMARYIENKQVFKIFRAFISQAAVKNSPEIQALDEIIAAKERQVKSATRKFWMPTVALQGGYSNTFLRDGEGTDASLGVDLPIEIDLPEPKDAQWNVAINASLPLYAGGSRFAERKQAMEELHQYRLQRESTAEKIEQRMRSSLHLLGASFASIQQAKLSAKAAEKSLQVVKDSYSQGVVSIVELLDAQNAALVSKQAASTAVYDFFVKLIETERAFGGYFFLMGPEKLAEMEGKVVEYFREKGIQFEN